MYLLIEVAGYINTWPTILLVMLTAVIGVALLKQQGLSTLTRGVNRMNSGQVPATEMAEGLLLAVAGALLVTPGFITDFVGFTLLFPPSRMLIAAQLLKRVQFQASAGMQGGMHTGGAHMHGEFYAGSGTTPPGSRDGSAGAAPRDRVTLEGEFERKP